MRDFTRTRAALAAFDAYDGYAKMLATRTTDEIRAVLREEERLGQAVGEAFGLDTSDINSMNTCRGLVRPGPWLRRILEENERERQVASQAPEDPARDSDPSRDGPEEGSQ